MKSRFQKVEADRECFCDRDCSSAFKQDSSETMRRSGRCYSWLDMLAELSCGWLHEVTVNMRLR